MDPARLRETCAAALLAAAPRTTGLRAFVGLDGFVDEIVHLVDLFPTLATWVGGEIPKDRVLDGADQTAFLTGKAKKSARESIVIYIGNELFGVKWRNWKLLVKEIDPESYAIRNMAYASVYNLLIDPKEEEPEMFYLDDTWVDAPLWQVMEDHTASIAADAGAPDS